jgi:hypothetical protein
MYGGDGFREWIRDQDWETIRGSDRNRDAGAIGQQRVGLADTAHGAIGYQRQVRVNLL